MTLLDPLRTWFRNLQPREQRVVTAGGAVLALVLAWLVVWEPLQGALAERRERVERQARMVQELERIAAEARRLRQQVGSSGGGSGDLLTLANRSATSMGLGGDITRVQPQGDRRLQVWFERVAFNDFLRWLETMQVQHGLSVSSLSLDRHQDPGRVNARVTLERPS